MDKFTVVATLTNDQKVRATRDGFWDAEKLFDFQKDHKNVKTVKMFRENGEMVKQRPGKGRK